MSNTQVDKDALFLIEAIKNELAMGTKHYNTEGKLLTTPLDIVTCMLDEGRVTIEPTPDRAHGFESYNARLLKQSDR